MSRPQAIRMSPDKLIARRRRRSTRTDRLGAVGQALAGAVAVVLTATFVYRVFYLTVMQA